MVKVKGRRSLRRRWYPWSLCRGSETFTFARMYPWGSRFCDMQQNTIPNFIKCDNYLLFLFSLSKTRLIVNQYSLEEISNKTDFYTVVLYICRTKKLPLVCRCQNVTVQVSFHDNLLTIFSKFTFPGWRRDQ